MKNVDVLTLNTIAMCCDLDLDRLQLSYGLQNYLEVADHVMYRHAMVNSVQTVIPKVA